jgi:hypothetical protein
MLKKTLIIFSLLTSLHGVAQVTVNVQLPPGGMVQKDQLWNLVLVNNKSEMTDISISLDVQDAVTGQSVLSASSRMFVLGKGVKLLSQREVQPVQYNYVATEFTQTYLPLGNYIACYRVIKNDVKGAEAHGDECVRINITPLSPPLLNTPLDRTVIETGYPQFSWLPPAPLDLFSSLSYDMIVAEIMEGQTPSEAVLYNAPVYTETGLHQPYKSFPATFTGLKQGQHYAWQVVARNGLNYSAQTETWSFRINTVDTLRTPVVSRSYVELKGKHEPIGVVTVGNEELLVKFYSFDKEHETLIRFFTADGKLVKEQKQLIRYGDNFIRFKLGNRFDKEKTYSVRLADSQKRIYQGKFRIQ